MGCYDNLIVCYGLHFIFSVETPAIFGRFAFNLD